MDVPSCSQSSDTEIIRYGKFKMPISSPPPPPAATTNINQQKFRLFGKFKVPLENTPGKAEKEEVVSEIDDDVSAPVKRKRQDLKKQSSVVVDLLLGKANSNNNNHMPQSAQKIGRIGDHDEQTLPTLHVMKERNVETFLHFFESTYLMRLNSEKSGIEESNLPSLDGFQHHFRVSMSSESGLIRQMRLANVSVDSIRRAAASALFFLSYSWIMRKEYFVGCNEKFSFSIDILEVLTSMTSQQKSDLIVRFIVWYESIPPLRTSPTKLLAANMTPCRLYVKESGTLFTVARGLLAYFTYIGVVSPSNSKNPTDESSAIWAAVKTSMQNSQLRKGGPLDLSQASLGLSDLVQLMVESSGCDSLFEVQSWLLSMILAGSGLRLGSIRNQWAKNKTNKYFALSESEDDLSETEDAFEQDGNNEDNGKTENDATFLDVSFDCLRRSSLKVYRVRKHLTDPICTVRLRVELEVSSTKTTGHRSFMPTKHGYTYPRMKPDGSLDWSPNVAIALAMISVMVGTTEIGHIYKSEYEPKNDMEQEITNNSPGSYDGPLFRASSSHQHLEIRPMRNMRNSLKIVADRLQIPYTLFTSRAYRRGFAKTVLESVVLRGDSGRVVTKDTIRNALFTSAQWRSNQADKYLNNVSNCVRSHSSTGMGITAEDWITASFQCSVGAKKLYAHIPNDCSTESLLEKSESTSKEQLELLTKDQKRQFIDALNFRNWKKASSPDTTLDEKKLHLLRGCKLDMEKTMQQFEKLLENNCLSQPFCGFGKCSKIPPYVCPVLNCNNSTHSSIQSSNDHWMASHDEKKTTLTYMCNSCLDSGISKYRYYLRHLQKKTEKTTVKFKWIVTADDTN